MDSIFVYIIKFSGLITLFFSSYYLLLRKETFFNSNRWFLLAGLFTSLILPLLVYSKIVWIDPSPTKFNFNVNQVNQNVPVDLFEIYFIPILVTVYSLITAFFIVKFILDFYSLKKIIKGKTIHKQSDFKHIDVQENIAPFSFFSFIVYNSTLYNQIELENIIEHEKVHSEQNHTLDVLISRIFCILFWFNPIVWLYKKAIIQNLEFIADKEASLKIADKKNYQYTLLKITTHENCVAITNHFYQSLIKKRIVMLNKNQSKKRNYLKYVVVIPALIAFVLLFQIQTIAQERETINLITKEEPVTNNSISKKLVVSANSTKEDLDEIVASYKSEQNLDLKFSGIKRNSSNEIIAIKATMKLEGKGEKTYQVKSDKPIQSFAIFYESENSEIKNYGFNTSSKGDVKPISSVTVTSKIDTITNGDKKVIVINTKTNSDVNTNINTNVNSNQKIVLHDNINAKRLIIIDGKEFDSDAILKDVNPNSIETIHVYKDNNAVKVYGEKGKNGVIVIKTKVGDADWTTNTIDVEAEVEKAKKEVEKAKIEIERSKVETEKSKKEVEKAKKEAEKARLEIEKSKI